MERIYISEDIEKIRNEYYSKLFSERRTNFNMPKEKLKKLASTIWKAYRKGTNHNVSWDKYFRYVKNIIRHYDDIIALKPSQFDIYHIKYFNELTGSDLARNIISSKHFYELVVEAMRYDDVRNTEYAPYVRKLDIKTCIYCNAQFSLPTHGKGNANTDVTTYEIDHFYPKSIYPFLCTTFFNLAPSCGPCNRRKSDNKVEFCLYTEDKSECSPFHFLLSKQSVTNYLITNKKDDLDFAIEGNGNLLESHKVFYLDDIYKEHKDVAEELVWRHKIYSQAYRNSILSQFKKIFDKQEDDDCYRLLFGIYPSSTHIHKRPLTLFSRDLSKQLEEMFDSKY